MCAKRVGENTKSVGENGKGEALSTVALTKAKEAFDVLLQDEFRGLGDREKSALGRLAVRTGVSVSYLERLKYKFHQMTDVRGEPYRLLMAAKEAYERECERHERAADQYEHERIGLTHAATQGAGTAHAGMVATETSTLPPED